MTTFPTKITFLTDDTEVKFVDEVLDKKAKERKANYIFTKGKVNKGKSLCLLLDQIEKLFSDKRIIIK